MKAVRLITNKCKIFLPIKKELILQKTFIFPAPKGKFLVVGFCEHLSTSSPFPKKFLETLIEKDVGIVYVCDKVLFDPIIDEHIVYVETGWKWFLHTIFFNPLIFKGVFYVGQGEKYAKAFSCFTEYKIPLIEKFEDIDTVERKQEEAKNKICLEIRGGVGDFLMTIPSLKTLAHKGFEVYVLCDKHRKEIFKNLDYIKGIYTKKEDIDISEFGNFIWLDFGAVLNDYRLDLNKQNRIYAVAQLCGLSADELIIKRPEIILSEEEILKMKLLYGDYSKKVFVGIDSARHDSKYPLDLAQKLIDELDKRGYTVFTTSLRKLPLENCINLSQKLSSVRELFALIYIMDFVITVDTSFLHIAGAFEKPTVALMSIMPAEWRCSTYRNCIALEPQIDCFYCLGGQRVEPKKRKCWDGKLRCFYTIPIEKILESLEKLENGKISVSNLQENNKN